MAVLVAVIVLLAIEHLPELVAEVVVWRATTRAIQIVAAGNEEGVATWSTIVIGDRCISNRHSYSESANRKSGEDCWNT